jgi:ATP-dependent protease HslVU (ClpYQ) peptidase subunit
MTVCLAAKYDGGVLCCTDSAITYGDNRFSTPTIKGEYRWDGFVMYAGEPWLCHEVVWDKSNRELIDVIKSAAYKYRAQENSHPVFPGEFLQVTNDGTELWIYGQGEVFGSYDYACVGAGSSTAWPVLDVLYKRVRNRTAAATKAMLAEVARMCEKYDATVYRPFLFEDIPDA